MVNSTGKLSIYCKCINRHNSRSPAGLHHQGIFRVSGSQVEISNFREGFERGEDQLADTTDASDINSVAGVLKLYLRELREPLFPIIYFDHFVTLAREYWQRLRGYIVTI